MAVRPFHDDSVVLLPSLAGQGAVLGRSIHVCGAVVRDAVCCTGDVFIGLAWGVTNSSQSVPFGAWGWCVLSWCVFSRTARAFDDCWSEVSRGNSRLESGRA